MMETAQPQAVDTANQPEENTAPARKSGAGDNVIPDEPFMTVRYNKEEKPLSKEEAITYAQKGMNYDKLHGRLREMAVKLSEYESGSQEKGGESGEAAKQAVIDGQLERFMSRNPGVDPRKLPQSVIDSWKEGVPLTEAYLAHQAGQLGVKLRELEKAATQAEANRRNEAASMGSAVTNGATRGRQISEESIRGMTPEELDRNHERIWAYLTGK
jgi:hypothetical protein